MNFIGSDSIILVGVWNIGGGGGGGKYFSDPEYSEVDGDTCLRHWF